MAHEFTAHPALDASTHAEDDRKRKGRTALRAATVAFFVDMFDVYLPVIALAPAIVYFTPGGMSLTSQATLFYVIFAVSLVGRPLGSLIFGPLGDRIGRRKTTLIATTGFTVCTGLIAILPGYEAWGYVGAGLLIVLRLADGIFLGGEYTAANPLAMEYAPRNRRGVFGATINSGYPLALAAITLMTMGTLQLFPAGDATSAYAVWGWRVPFAVGFVMSLAVTIYYWRSVPESELWVQESANRSPDHKPLRTLFSGANRRALGQVFIVMTGAWLTLNAVAGALPGVLKTTLEVSAQTTNIVILVGALIAAAMFPLVGHLGQLMSRRRLLIILGVTNLIVTPVLYAMAVDTGNSSVGTLILFLALVEILTLAIWSVVTAYITESFPTSVRASGYGIGYSLASIVPAFYPFYMLGMGKVIPYEYTQVVLLALGGAILALGAYLGTDRRSVDLGS